MTDLGLTVVLSYDAREISRIGVEAEDLLAHTQALSEEIGDLENRVARLAEKVGVDARPKPAPVSAGIAQPSAPPVFDTWHQLLEKAQAAVESEGPSLDDLMDPGRAELIEDIHGGRFDGSITLDQYDIAAAVLAGVAGSLVDLLAVGIPTGGVWNGEWESGSEVTFRLRSGALDPDNWLSGLAKVPFDRVNDTGIAGMGPGSHRVQTFGHDPFLGWALGTLDIMRGTLTGIDTASTIHVVDVGHPTPNILAAIGLQTAHLLSDVFTKMGLPLPGWTALLAVPYGQFGPDGLSVGQLARWMYLRGYGTWHLGTMALSVGVVEAVVRSYYALRQLVDEDYEYRVEVERKVSEARRAGQEPRYRSISLLAHGIATAGNLGKFALYGANPLSFNIAQWTMFARRLVQRVSVPPAGDRIVGQYRANAAVIDTGWAQLSFRDIPVFSVTR